MTTSIDNEVMAFDDDFASKVYIKIDDKGNIVRCEGGYTTPQDLTDWIYIDEGYGDKYNLCQSNYFDDGLYTMDGLYRYKYINGQIVKKTEQEIAEEYIAPEYVPTDTEKLRADIDFLAAMSGVEL